MKSYASNKQLALISRQIHSILRSTTAVRTTAPQLSIEVPNQLNDGILDINSGESAELHYSGKINEKATDSPFSYGYITLYNETSKKSIYLNIGSHDIKGSRFDIYHDASWDSGNYKPKSAAVQDEAGNYASVYASGNQLTKTEIDEFKTKTGIDLSSKAFNFEIKNTNKDTTPPKINNLTISGANLSDIGGKKTLTAGEGRNSTITIKGQLRTSRQDSSLYT